jgi:hypothetical protein
VADLAGLAQGGPRIVVVFDGGGNPASDGAPHHLGSLSIIFSPAGVTADTVVEALALRSRDRGERAVVVTSDAATRDTVRSGTISVQSSDRFAVDLMTDSASRAELGTSGRRVPVARRIPPEVSATLSRWARGRAPDARA